MRSKSIIAAFTALVLCAGFLISCDNFKHDELIASDNGDPAYIQADASSTGSPSWQIIGKSNDFPDAKEQNATVPSSADSEEGLTPVISDISSDDADPDISPAPSTPSSLTLCLLGDIMCLSGQQYAASQGDGSHDYTGCYSLIRPIFDECDYVIGNLETCIAPSSPYAGQQKTIAGAPNCNAPADLLASLTEVGITHLVTANNHCLDADIRGIYETVDALDSAGIRHTGTHTPETVTDNDSDYMLIQSEDICIAVISVTELINRRGLVAPDDMYLYVNEYGPDLVSDKIKRAREEGASYVIVYEHWGNENTHEAFWFQKDHAAVIAEAGADLIIGSHSHCIQPSEILQTSDGRQVPCYYSLGNVVSSMANEINHDTVLVKLNLSRSGSGPDNALSAEITNIPCHVIWRLDGVPFVIAPTDYDTGHESDNATLKTAEERILNVLDGNIE